MKQLSKKLHNSDPETPFPTGLIMTRENLSGFLILVCPLSILIRRVVVWPSLQQLVQTVHTLFDEETVSYARGRVHDGEHATRDLPPNMPLSNSFPGSCRVGQMALPNSGLKGSLA
jgi:hypothetical protein